MYDNSQHVGDSPEFWEDNWEGIDFENSVRFCSIDPVRPLFEKYSKPGSLLLEGGCGIGHLVTYYNARGWRVIGLDFAQQTLKLLQQRQHQLTLCCGDVSRLPFDDETFDIYYSGGVVEHFENGPMPSLKEACRVLKPDGTLLVSVPYYSPLKKCLMPFRKKNWRRVTESKVDEKEFSPGFNFFQYAYEIKEFKKILAEAGLRVVETQGYGVLWGMYELPFFQGGKTEKHLVKAKPNGKKEITQVNVNDLIPTDQQPSYLKRLVVGEDDTVPVGGLVVKVMRWACANMMMYVCKKSV